MAEGGIGDGDPVAEHAFDHDEVRVAARVEQRDRGHLEAPQALGVRHPKPAGDEAELLRRALRLEHGEAALGDLLRVADLRYLFDDVLLLDWPAVKVSEERKRGV